MLLVPSRRRSLPRREEETVRDGAGRATIRVLLALRRKARRRVRARSTAKDGRSQGAEAGQVDSGSSGRLSGSRRSSAQARRSAPALACSCALRFRRLRRSAAANRARRSGPAARGEPPSRSCRCESSIGARVPATVGCVNQPCQVPRRRGIVESNSGRQRRFEFEPPPDLLPMSRLRVPMSGRKEMPSGTVRMIGMAAEVRNVLVWRRSDRRVG